MATAKLKILSIDRYSQTFGNTDYAMYVASTQNDKQIVVGISHNMLQSSGIGSALYDALVGSTIIVKDDIDLSTGLLRKDALQRVSDVEQKLPRNTLLLVNSSNSELLKTDALRMECVDYSVRVDSIVKVEKERARTIERNRRRMEQLREQEQKLADDAAKRSTQESLEKENLELDEEFTKEIKASLENNEEIPF
jgi:hypothetical protein